MPINNINVKLNKDETPWLLDVEDHGGENVVHKHGDSTKIVWKLTGDLANGKFAAMNGSDPGFQWEEPTPVGLFGTPKVTNGGKHLELTDNQSGDNATNGDWVYKLRVLHEDTIYTTKTVLTGPGATSKNPVIINKDP